MRSVGKVQQTKQTKQNFSCNAICDWGQSIQQGDPGEKRWSTIAQGRELLNPEKREKERNGLRGRGGGMGVVINV